MIIFANGAGQQTHTDMGKTINAPPPPLAVDDKVHENCSIDY